MQDTAAGLKLQEGPAREGVGVEDVLEHNVVAWFSPEINGLGLAAAVCTGTQYRCWVPMDIFDPSPDPGEILDLTVDVAILKSVVGDFFGCSR